MKNLILVIFPILFIVNCKQPYTNQNNVSTIQNASNSPEETIDTLSELEHFFEFVLSSNTDSLDAFIQEYGISFWNERKIYYGFLEKAIISPELPAIGYLMDKGFRFNEVDLYNLAFKYLKDTVKINHLVSSSPAPNFNFIFGIALQHCNIEALEFILNKRINPNIVYLYDEEGSWVHYHSSFFINNCDSSAIQIYRMLDEAGMKTNDSNIEYLLTYKLTEESIPKFSDSEFIEYLLDIKQLKESNEWSPLKSCAFWKENELIKLFLDHGFSPNWNGSSDLLFNAYHKVGNGFGDHITNKMRIEAIQLLLDGGANPQLKNNYYRISNVQKMSFHNFLDKYGINEITEWYKKYTR